MLHVGIDTVEIERIAEAMKHERFLLRFFSAKERELFYSRGNAPQVVAANFAAKEAFSKALGSGIRGFSLYEVQALRDEMGKPYYEFSGRALDLVQANGFSFSLSITHTRNIATAIAAAYEKGDF